MATFVVCDMGQYRTNLMGAVVVVFDLIITERWPCMVRVSKLSQKLSAYTRVYTVVHRLQYACNKMKVVKSSIVVIVVMEILQCFLPVIIMFVYDCLLVGCADWCQHTLYITAIVRQRSRLCKVPVKPSTKNWFLYGIDRVSVCTFPFRSQ